MCVIIKSRKRQDKKQDELEFNDHTSPPTCLTISLLLDKETAFIVSLSLSCYQTVFDTIMITMMIFPNDVPKLEVQYPPILLRMSCVGDKTPGAVTNPVMLHAYEI